MKLNEIIEKGINGLSIDEINERSKPLVDKYDDIERYHCRSHMGFLGDLSFIEQLKEDDKIVKSLSLTHEDIAFHLKSILEKAEETRRELNKGPDSTVDIIYDSNLKDSKPQKLRILHKTYLSPQWSLFKNYEHEENNLTEEDLMCWKDESLIENIEMGTSILVGGNSSSGIIKYIERYGFYEGGILNEYRIDPRIMYSIITGHKSKEVYQVLKSKIEAKEMILYNQYNIEKNQILSLSNDMSEEEMNTWLNNAESKFNEEIKALRKLKLNLSNVYKVKS